MLDLIVGIVRHCDFYGVLKVVNSEFELYCPINYAMLFDRFRPAITNSPFSSGMEKAMPNMIGRGEVSDGKNRLFLTFTFDLPPNFMVRAAIEWTIALFRRRRPRSNELFP